MPTKSISLITHTIAYFLAAWVIFMPLYSSASPAVEYHSADIPHSGKIFCEHYCFVYFLIYFS